MVNVCDPNSSLSSLLPSRAPSHSDIGDVECARQTSRIGEIADNVQSTEPRYTTFKKSVFCSALLFFCVCVYVQPRSRRCEYRRRLK